MPESASQATTWFMDVTRLCKPRLSMSGISRYGRNMLKGLRRYADANPQVMELVLIIPEGNKSGPHDLRKYKNELGSDVQIINKERFASLVAKAQGAGRVAIYYSIYEELPDWSNLVGVVRAVTVHDLFHLERRDAYGTDFKNKHSEQLEASLRPSDIIITVSEYTRARVITCFGHPPEKVRTVSLAPEAPFVDHDSLQGQSIPKADDIGSNYFVFFAQFDPRKNLPASLAGILSAYDNGLPEDAKCVLVTNERFLKKVEGLIEEQEGNDEKFVILSDLSDEQLALLYKGARFLLFATMAEGFGLPVVEAFASGCPAVTSSTTSLPEVAGNGALYVNPEESDQISKAVSLMFSSDSLHSCLKEHALKVAKLFRWGSTVSETMAFIHAAARSSRMIFGKDEIDLVPPLEEREGTLPAKALRGRIFNGPSIMLSDRKQSESNVLFETAEKGVHGFQYTFPKLPCDGPIEVAFPLKLLARKSVSLMIWSDETRKDNKNQIIVDYDWATGAFKLVESSHSQVLSNASLVRGRQGWGFLSLQVDLRLEGESGISVVVAAKIPGEKGVSYNGEEMPAFVCGEMYASEVKDEVAKGATVISYSDHLRKEA